MGIFGTLCVMNTKKQRRGLPLTAICTESGKEYVFENRKSAAEFLTSKHSKKFTTSAISHACNASFLKNYDWEYNGYRFVDIPSIPDYP